MTPSLSTTANVVVRPPVLFLAAVLLGQTLDRVSPLMWPPRAGDAFCWIAGGTLILGGLAIARAGIRDFSRAGTPVPTNQPTSALVTNGMHGWSRNPIYVGMLLLYAGIGIAARSPWILILGLPLVIVMRTIVVAREEAYLERRFVQPRPSDKPPADQILATFDSLERRFSSKDFRGCPFVNAVAELGAEDKSVRKIAVAFKESRRLWFRDLLMQLGVADADALATQLALLVDGSIAQDLVRNDPAMARAAKEAATVLLRNAGVKVGGSAATNRRVAKKRPSRPDS